MENDIRQWLRFCRRKDPINIKTAIILSLHFGKDYFLNNTEYEMGFTGRRSLKPEAVPKLHLSEGDAYVPNALQCSRSNRMAIRQNKEVVEMTELDKENCVLRTRLLDSEEIIRQLEEKYYRKREHGAETTRNLHTRASEET